MILLLLFACDHPTCLDGDEACEMPTPCPEVEYTCSGGSTDAYVLAAGQSAPGGMDALAAPGDIVLSNDRVVVVLDALDHPHYIAPAGGAIVDFSIRGKDNDSLRHIFGAVGLLPTEAFHYTSARIIDDGETKAVQYLGTLDGFPDVPVATRYEIHPCEPGVRVRTEIANGSADAMSLYLTDAFYWGDRESIPFTPRRAGGFFHPSFGLSTIADAFYEVPFMVAGLHSDPAVTYGVVSCDDEQVAGFQSVYVSAMGKAPRVFGTRDWDIYERFLFATDGPSISHGVDEALELRKQLWDEPYATISGRIEAPGGHLGSTMRASLELASDGVPWTHILPGDDGSFTARVPDGAHYSVEVEAFGKIVQTLGVDVNGDTDVGTITLPAVGEVTLDVQVDGVSDHALVFVIPSDDATAAAVSATTFQQWEPCAPLLGLPHGASPACNRVLVDGPTTLALPEGTYDFYTSAGPFATLGAARGVHVDGSTAQSVPLSTVQLPIKPGGTIDGDFHVHGSASFDSEIPDVDRVKAFLASKIDFVATTEHDVIDDYADAIDELDAGDRLLLATGTESTGHILFQLREDVTYPQVIGHWIFWPMPYDPEGPYRGAAWDEKAEPGMLFTNQQAEGWDDEIGVAQLNHPFGGSQFGRDYSWGSAAGFNLNEPLKPEYDGTGQSMFFHTPEGASFSNADYDVQEVMNGSKNENFLAYRAFWFYLLDQGIVRGGTANSDSHSLVENVLGTPRNVVFTSTTKESFDLATFDADVRAGHIVGTNGPMIVATIGEHTPGVESFTPGGDDVLHVEVSAAPWVPVDELRIYVNGELVETDTDLVQPADPYGSQDLARLSADYPLDDLLPASGDAWIVVEVGHALVENGDLDCNGVPDTGDNNGDGVIDWQDVEALTEDPGTDCFTDVGPMAEPPEPDRDTPDWLFRTVTPNGYPLAFTNPFLIDRDGDGFSGVTP